jgi:hypothetical protein
VSSTINGSASTVVQVPTSLGVSAPASATAGTVFFYTVTALDQFGNPIPSFTGTVHFTSTDPEMHLPADAKLVNGVGQFAALPVSAGSQTITATDTVTSSLTGTSGTIAVGSGFAVKLWLIYPATANLGVPYNITVKARDHYGNTATGYNGIVTFVCADNTATLPANGTLTNGVGTFTMTFNTNGTKGFWAHDTATPSIGGASSAIGVSPGVSYLRITSPATATVGVPYNVVVSVRDRYGDPVVAYNGTVHFASNQRGETLPPDSKLTNGVGTFSVTVNTAGHEVIVATDTVNPALAGSCLTVVSP